MPRVRRFEDVSEFRSVAEPFLMRDEARHNLQLGICSRLEKDLHAFGGEAPYLSIAMDGEDPVAVAIRTPPFNLLLSRMDAADVDALAGDVGERFESIPGVSGEPEIAARFGDAWRDRTGRAPVLGMSTRIHQLASVPEIPAADGRYRVAAGGDRNLLIAWFDAFGAEAHPGQVEVDSAATVDLRLSGEDGGLALWDDGATVSFAGFGGATPNGIRIGPVYTPPALRGRGYAAACVATLSRDLLEREYRFCFLFTDLANPVSNRLYERLGYEPVCDLQEIRFDPAG